MKLNATTEMIPVTWPQFSDIHPFAPLDQAQGYIQLINELESDLARVTGFDSVSLQPNSGFFSFYSGLKASILDYVSLMLFINPVVNPGMYA